MEKILEDHFMDWDLEKFPIHDNYGEGFSFSVNNEKYITKGSYDYQNKEYRNLVLEITTFGVQHYYASIKVAVNNIEIDKPSHMIGGYLGGVVIPDKCQRLKIEMHRKVTLEEKNNFPNRWGDYDVDDFTNAFYNEEDDEAMDKYYFLTKQHVRISLKTDKEMPYFENTGIEPIK